MARIYLTGSGPTNGYYTGSGVVSNPARVLIREKDDLLGSYPTIARTGDPDFTGKFRSTFDDLKILNFITQTVVYPTALRSDSVWVSGGVARPNTLQGLQAIGKTSAGVSDNFITFSSSENLSPFNDTRIYIDSNKSFYSTGTMESVLPGFSQRLASKTSIKLSYNNSTPVSVNFTTGSFNKIFDKSFTVNGYTYSAHADLHQQWRLDTPQRSGTLSSTAGNYTSPQTTGSSGPASGWDRLLDIPDSSFAWNDTVSDQRPQLSGSVTDSFAASTYYSGSSGVINDTNFPWNFETNFSISFWIKFDKIDSFYGGKKGVYDETTVIWSSFNLDYEAGIDGNGAIHFLAWTDGAPNYRQFKTEDFFVREGTWYLLTFAYNESASPKLAIYRNGDAATLTTVQAGAGSDYGMTPGNRFGLPRGASSFIVSTNSGSIGNYCDLSIHRKKISQDDHRAMFYAPFYPSVWSNTGLSYFNFSNSRWDIVGASGSIDYTSPLLPIATASYLAFTPKYGGASIGALFDSRNPSLVARTIGVPTDFNGFPHDARFNPAQSQLFCLSSSISAPFLVEKIVYSFSASLPPAVSRTNGATGDGPECTQIFILKASNERYGTTDLPDSVQIVSGGVFVPGIGQAASSKQQTYSFVPNVTKNNLLVDVGTIAQAESYIDGYYRDLNLSNSSVTGTFRVESTAKVFGATGFTALKSNRYVGGAGYRPGVQPDVRNVGKMGYVPGNHAGILRNQFGGRDGLGIATSEGRSYIASVVGSQISGSVSLNYLPFIGATNTERTTFLTNRTYNYNAPVYSVVTSSAPIVLLPNDKISIGFCYHPMQPVESLAFNGEQDDEQKIGLPDRAAVLLPGPVEITLFGSLLQNNQPIDSETNQPLTSDAIHEDLHYDNPIFDQFDVEPYASLAGSYTDLIVTGSMLALPLGNPFASNVRQVQASVASGQGGTTGSLQRFVRLEADTFLNEKKQLVKFSPIFDSQTLNFTSSAGKEILLTGSTYGLIPGREKFLSLVIRRDRFGQFRDILEQMACTYNGPAQEGDRPVSIDFYSRAGKDGKGNFIVDDPLKTHSQNVSKFSTSSLPFFDREKSDLGTDRDDDPDKTLKYIDVTFPTQ